MEHPHDRVREGKSQVELAENCGFRRSAAEDGKQPERGQKDWRLLVLRDRIMPGGAAGQRRRREQHVRKIRGGQQGWVWWEEAAARRRRTRGGGVALRVSARGGGERGAPTNTRTRAHDWRMSARVGVLGRGGGGGWGVALRVSARGGGGERGTPTMLPKQRCPHLHWAAHLLAPSGPAVGPSIMKM